MVSLLIFYDSLDIIKRRLISLMNQHTITQFFAVWYDATSTWSTSHIIHVVNSIHESRLSWENSGGSDALSVENEEVIELMQPVETNKYGTSIPSWSIDGHGAQIQGCRHYCRTIRMIWIMWCLSSFVR